MKYIFILIAIVFFGSCDRSNEKSNDKILAKVYDKHLYKSDVQFLFSDGYSKSDSLEIIKNYIDKWIKKQLLLQKAEYNLNPEQKDVSKQLEDYRSSLLIFKYEEGFINQKLDTIVDDDAIEEYFNENTPSFILTNNIVKASFIKMPNASPYVDRVKEIYRSTDEEDLKQLDSYCFQTATKYDFFEDKWVVFSDIQQLVPYEINRPEDYLKRRSYIETQDSLFSYFVHIREYKVKGEESPVEYVQERIENIILNKRKIQLLKELESNIYTDALNKNQLVIY